MKLKITNELNKYKCFFENTGFSFSEPILQIKKWYGYKTVITETEKVFSRYETKLYTPNQYRVVFNPMIAKYENYIKEWAKETL